MYTSQITKERIKNLCKEQKVPMEKMLSDLNLGINAIRQINDTKGMSSVSLCKIADYLNVSVDYLLGRTDNPEISTAAITTGDINNSRIDNSLNINTNRTTNEISELFDSLTLVQRAKVIVMIDEMKKGE